MVPIGESQDRGSKPCLPTKMKKMRIGILTLPLHTNYGGILQAYALQTVLERMGHEVVVFDTPNRMPLPPLKDIPKCFLKRIVKKLLGRNQKIFYEYYQNKKVIPVVSQNTQKFINSYIHRKEIRVFNELDEKSYDAIVVGSDQVWRPLYFVPGWRWQEIDNAFLAFTCKWNVKRLSYAASFGTDNWEYTDQQTRRCKALLLVFDAISVRETNGVTLCKKYFDIDSVHVLDPTMLLNEVDYSIFFQKANTPKSNGTLLNYILDENEKKRALIMHVANQKSLRAFSVTNPHENDETIPLNERIKPSVEKWLRGFYDAEFVITDSFHACVFSILFKKQFVVVGNKERGLSRIESLLQCFGIENRIVEDSAQVMRLPLIDYDAVYVKLEEYRKKSFEFLNVALG